MGDEEEGSLVSSCQGTSGPVVFLKGARQRMRKREGRCEARKPYFCAMRRFALFIFFLLFVAAASAQKGQPTLKETLEWMHNAFPDSQSVSEVRLGQTREFNFVDGKQGAPPSCVVTIVEHWSSNGKPKTRDTIVDLSLIDPESIVWGTDDTLIEGTGELTIIATNDKKVIVEKLEGEKGDKPYLTERLFISFVGSDYAQRFAKAFKNAAVQCGGKTSTF